MNRSIMHLSQYKLCFAREKNGAGMLEVSYAARETTRLTNGNDVEYVFAGIAINPFTPKSDQFRISPAAPPEILHHTARRTWLFIAYLDEIWLHYQFALPHLYISPLKSSEKVLFELGSGRVNPFTPRFKKYILPTFQREMYKWGSENQVV